MKLTEDHLNHVLLLAHLDIDSAEKVAYLAQLQHILDYMKQLDRFDLDDVEPSAYATQSAQILREDKVVKQGDLLLEKNAPEWEGHCFVVPSILGETSS